MRSKLYNLLRNTFFKSKRLAGLDKQQILLGQIRADQIKARGKLRSLADAEFSVFSQWGEDGIISWLVDTLNIETTTFIEFGVEDFREANSRYLMVSRNWSGLIIDGSQININAVRGDDIAYKYDLKTQVSFIDRDNIMSIIAKSGYGDSVGILSVDIDGVDFWVLEKITTHADVVIVEYNDLFGNAPLSVPYDAQFVRREKHPSGMYWGASLAAFKHLLEQRGYVFAGTNSVGTNAFFVNKKYDAALAQKLQSRVSYPCKMREARNHDGSLAYLRYDEMAEQVQDLPLVNVETGAVTSLAGIKKID
jgi:hypothetical protein